MSKKLTDLEIGDFLYNLERGEDCQEKRRYTHNFIKKHDKEISDYLDQKIGQHLTLNSIMGKERIRKILDKYRTFKPYIINDETYASRRSFKKSDKHKTSMTFESNHKVAKVRGYILAGLITGGIIYSGILLKNSIEEIVGSWGSDVEYYTNYDYMSHVSDSSSLDKTE